MKTDNQPIQFEFSALEKHLLNDYQHRLPNSLTPYADMAKQYGVTEQEVIKSLKHLQEIKVISRIGAVFKANTVGASTLAAIAVEPEQLQNVANIVSSYQEVNHNYEREHRYNLWFVLTTANQKKLEMVLTDISRKTGYHILNLPMLKDFYINLGFKLQWH